MIAANLAPGLAVDVLIYNPATGRPEWTGRGTVTAIYTADDRPYRLNVQGAGAFTGRYWRGCAPECVRPAPCAVPSPADLGSVRTRYKRGRGPGKDRGR